MTDRVIIAGGGPVGLIAALALGKQDIPVLLLEREDDLPIDLRASTFHPPTLDMLDAFELTERLIEHGLIASTWQIRDRESGPVATFDMALLEGDTQHPYRVQCEQGKLSGFIAEKLAGLSNVEVRFGHRVEKILQNSAGARVEVQTPGGQLNLEARFVIGADGANSTVRRSLKVAFEGFTYPERYLVLSTPFPFEEHIPQLAPINYISDPEEWLVLLRVPGLWRVLFPTPRDSTPEEILRPASVQGLLQKLHPKLDRYELAHQTLYPVHQRVAERYRVGSVFLAGDAAHINNPLGGMGLNGGIHDALCLAGLLADVWRGGASKALEAYERKRRPIAIDYVKQATMRNQQLMEERDPTKREAALSQIRADADDPERAREVVLRASMISAVRKAEGL